MTSITGGSPVIDRVRQADLIAAAARDIAAVSPGVVAFGVMLGVTVSTLHAGSTAAMLGAALVYGGSAQLTTITVLHLGGGLLAAVLSGAVVNARLMLYAAALEPWFREQPLWFRLFAPHFIVDQTYLSAVERPQIRGAGFRRYWAWLGGLLLVVWTGSVVIGLMLGPVLPPMPHLALMGTALFVAMVVPKLTDRTAVTAAVTAAAAALVVQELLPQLAVLGGSAAGALAALLHEGRERP